jgi:ABC-type transporter Mla subunit MlaD
VLDELAIRHEGLQRFVERGARVSRTTDRNRRALGAAVRRLPSMLDEITASLSTLRRISRSGTPVLADLRAAARPLESVTRSIPSFTRVATPAVTALAGASAKGLRALPSGGVTVGQARALAAQAGVGLPKLRRLLVNLRSRGGFEAAQALIYSMAGNGGGYDEVSHFVSAALNFYPQCFGQSGGPGCNSRYDAPRKGTVPVNDPSADAGIEGPIGPNPNAASRRGDGRSGARVQGAAGNSMPTDEMRQLLDFLLR